MMVLSKDLIKLSEEKAVNSGIFSYKELMHNAGNKASDIILKQYDCVSKKIAVICGNGNNGGDGFVVALKLYESGADVTVITPIGKPLTDNAAFYYSKLGLIKITDKFVDEYDIIIDALFGIGLNRELSEDIQNLINRINNSNSVKIAIDCPSGIEVDSGKIMGATVDADLTITFISLKPCFLLPPCSDYCGETEVVDIGVKPIEYKYLTIEKPVFKKRRHNSHKGSFGTALAFCGSYGMAGAAILSAKGALRSGVGIYKCVICNGIYEAFTVSVPEAVCVPIKQNSSGRLSLNNIDVEKLCSGCKSILFGCGVGNDSDIYNLLVKILNVTDKPVVIDADGINALCNGIDIIRNIKAPVILTPHPGEMARLCGVSVQEIENNRIKYAVDFVKDYKCYVVLKGANTIVASPCGEIYFNTTGNPGMATGGSGDVLAGIIVSLLSQQTDIMNALKSAVYIHGDAGDKACMKKGERAMLPSDIIEEL